MVPYCYFVFVMSFSLAFLLISGIGVALWPGWAGLRSLDVVGVDVETSWNTKAPLCISSAPPFVLKYVPRVTYACSMAVELMHNIFKLNRGVHH